MKQFKHWFYENEVSTAQQDAAPASSEVLRTGMQPQVDAQETKTSQKEDHDKMMAIDSQIQRILGMVGGSGTEKMTAIKKFCNQMAEEWERVKKGATEPPESNSGGLGGLTPNPKQIQFMQNNQPLPDGLGQSGMSNY